jgi:hypothetical protein
VPGGRAAFLGRILAHRRYDDAIGKRHAAQRDGGKQGAHEGLSKRRTISLI